MTAKRINGIYLRGNTFWYRYSHQGYQYRISLGTKDESEAIMKARQIIMTPELNPTDTLRREALAYIDFKRSKRLFTRRSADEKGRAILRFCDWVGKKEPARVTTKEVANWYHRLQKDVSESTAQGYLMAVRGFFLWLIEERKSLRENPVERVKLDTLPKIAREVYCTRDQVRELLDNCTRKDLKFILFCGFHEGLRREEIVMAQPQWFDLENKLLHVQSVFVKGKLVWEVKDKDDRTIPLTDAFCDFLRGYDFPSPFMLHPENNPSPEEYEHIRYRWDFRRPFGEYMNAMKYPWITPHIMRHTFASLLASAGVSIYKIANWLGDSIVVTERHYAHLSPKDRDIERGFAEKRIEETFQKTF